MDVKEVEVKGNVTGRRAIPIGWAGGHVSLGGQLEGEFPLAGQVAILDLITLLPTRHVGLGGVAGKRTIPIGWAGGHVGLESPFYLPAMLDSGAWQVEGQFLLDGLVAMLVSGGS